MSKVALGTGIVAGMVAIYAYTNDIDTDTINSRVESAKNEFALIVDDLITLGREALERIYNAIVAFVKRVIYKVQVIMQDYQIKAN